MADPVQPASHDHRQYRSAVEARLFDFALAVVPRLPRRVVVGLARFAGRAACLLARRDRRIALANLRLAFGEALDDRQRARIVRACFERFALTALDYLWFSRDTRRRLARYVTFDESLAKWIRHGGPWIAVTAHFGNWELLGKYSAMQGLTLASVAKPVRNRDIDERVNAFRETMGQVVVPRQGALRTLIRVLKKEKGVVALVLDQDTRVEEGGVFVPFFGVPASTAVGPARVSLKTGAPLVMGFAVRRADGRLDVEVEGPLEVPDPRAQDAVLRLTALHAALLEARVRARPELWFWLHRRWKTAPSAGDGAGGAGVLAAPGRDRA